MVKILDLGVFVLLALALIAILVNPTGNVVPTGYVVNSSPYPGQSSPSKPSSSYSNSLYVNSNPSDAEVYIDNARKGNTPVTVYNLTVGSHDVKIKKFGYYLYQQSVTIRDGQASSVVANLNSGQPVAVNVQNNAPARPAANAAPQPANNAASSISESLVHHKGARWRAAYTMQLVGDGPFVKFIMIIQVQNLGSPVKICARNINWDGTSTPEYCYGISGEDNIPTYASTSIYYNTYDSPGSPNTCAAVADASKPFKPFCTGAIVIHSKDNKQPIIPGGWICTVFRMSDTPTADWPGIVGGKQDFCLPLQFIQESDVLE